MLSSERQLECNNRSVIHIKKVKKLSVFQIHFVIYKKTKKYVSNSKFITRLGNLGYRLRDAPENFWLESNFHYFLAEIMWINNVELDYWFMTQL